MSPAELLRRWLPATLLMLGVGAGVYVKWPESRPVEPTTPLELPREERCNERGWCTQTLPGGPARETTFAATWAAGADDVWAVGLTGVAVHWDGAHWASVPTNTPILRGVYGFATNDVWMVGRQRALHWDGAQLTPHELAVDGELTDVFGTGPGDVWTVSTGGDTAHWDGNAWKVVKTPFPGWLEAVWGAAPNDYWAAGGHTHDGALGVIAHWDGHVWTQMPLPCNCQLTALSGTAPNDVWAVGSWGTILHYDGRTWSPIASPATRGLMGVAAHSVDDVWAVGEDSMVLHYEGKAWTATKPDWKWLRGVTATPTDVWAVGQDGWILRWKPSDFAATVQPNPLPVASSTQARPPPSAELERLSATEAEALARGRKLQADGKFQEAHGAFVAALGTGPSVHRQALAELAFLMASHGVGGRDEVEGAFLAAVNTEDINLEAPTWYNLASYYERANRPEKARVAMARAVMRRNPTVTADKLAGRSPCLAEIPTAASVEYPHPRVVTGWRGVCEAVERCATNERVTETVARERVCALDTEDGQGRTASCNDDGPWIFRYRTSPQQYRYVSAWVYALPAVTKPPRFFVGERVIAGHDAACSGSRTDAWRVNDGYAWFSSSETPLWPIPGRVTPFVEPEHGACGQSARTTTDGVFELETAAPLALVSQIDKYPVTLTLDAAKKRLELAGSQCDGHITLDGKMLWAGP